MANGFMPAPVYTGELPLGPVTVVGDYYQIDNKLEAVAAASDPPPPWQDAWLRSTRGRRNCEFDAPFEWVRPEECLEVWRAVRAAGSVPEDAAFFLVADEVERVVECLVFDRLAELKRRLDADCVELGFEEWSQRLNPADECERFKKRWPRAWDRLYVATLRSHGEEEMAKLYSDDRKRFKRKLAAGSAFFRPAKRRRPRGKAGLRLLSAPDSGD